MVSHIDNPTEFRAVMHALKLIESGYELGEAVETASRCFSVDYGRIEKWVKERKSSVT